MINTLEYIIPLANYATPLKHGITKNILMTIKQSRFFQKWFDDNRKNISKIPLNLKMKIVHDFCDEEVYNLYTKKNISYPLLSLPISVGGNGLDDNDEFVAAVINTSSTISHSSKKRKRSEEQPRNTLKRRLTEVLEDNERQTTEVLEDEDNNSNTHTYILKTPAIEAIGENKKRRLVYKLKFDNGKQFAMKIAWGIIDFVNEVNIYKELKEYPTIQSNIIKTFLLESEFKLEFKLEFKELIFEADGKKYSIDFEYKQLKNDIELFIKRSLLSSVNKYCIIIMEYNDDYITLQDYISYEPDPICDIVNTAIIKLGELNKLSGFAHLDLHSQNLLVDSKNNIPIFYDFDMSYTDRTNSSPYMNYFEKNCSVSMPYCKIIIEDLKRSPATYGFLIDILKLLKNSKHVKCFEVGSNVQKYLDEEFNAYDFEYKTLLLAVKLKDPNFYRYNKYKSKFLRVYKRKIKNEILK